MDENIILGGDREETLNRRLLVNPVSDGEVLAIRYQGPVWSIIELFGIISKRSTKSHEPRFPPSGHRALRTGF